MRSSFLTGVVVVFLYARTLSQEDPGDNQITLEEIVQLVNPLPHPTSNLLKSVQRRTIEDGALFIFLFAYIRALLISGQILCLIIR